ncbi:hypothetical protein PVOR_00870 [Paenibacillus vortex V453]|uniref:Uncharacterized protein n=1 Tax=Paenibacillus vortex V453 TaxID=715225 RepID=A0A2R9T2B1_9BACL|nr:hypothetical protein PVOR_00870 [Paenibacillus vortex V453]
MKLEVHDFRLHIGNGDKAGKSLLPAYMHNSQGLDYVHKKMGLPMSLVFRIFNITTVFSH